ncbi:hypothetical protein ACFWHR_12220 [Leucobacter sp. NPDC058333]|uniref:hypothetical protein n=1 Tax=Leucobacter sp. NPDC058333 TaxID=3346450 RepID=UPI0036631A03
MSDLPSTAQSTLLQCSFCLFTNTVIETEDALCKNCGLDLSRALQRRTQPEPEMIEPDTDVEQVAVEEPPPAETLSELLRVDAVEPETRSARRPSRAPWIIAGSFGVAIVLASVFTWLVVTTTPMAVTEEATPQTTVTLNGWTKTPAWVADVDATATAESADGATLLTTSRASASVIDTQTGDIIATQPLGDKAATAYWVGDTGVVVDGDNLHVWTSDTDMHTKNADGESDTGHDSDAWTTVDLDGDAFTIRGDMAFIVAKVGAKYERLNGDGTRDTIPVPTKGAVPVAATNKQIVWGTNKGVAYVTDADGMKGRDITLAQPNKSATVSRWVGGDEKHVYVVWTNDDKDTLVVHSLKSGDTFSTNPLPAAEDARATVTRNGASVAYANVLINATTGATTEIDHAVVAAVGDNFLGDDPAALIGADGKATSLKGDKVTPVAVSPDGSLIVNTGKQIAALTPKEPAASAQD